MSSDRFTTALARLNAAHAEDPNLHAPTGEPYELHYAKRMAAFLAKRDSSAGEVLRLAVCGQHFRRWEVPRDSYPATKAGYLSWRAGLKKRQARLVGEVLTGCGYGEGEVGRCRALIEKEGLRQGVDEEVVVLEDVACLVFLDDQFEEFREKHDDEKIVTILRKTWGKMSSRGQEMALELPMTDECKALVEKALNG